MATSTLTWTAGTSGLWSTPANWTPAQAPGTGDTALVTLAGAYLISVASNVTVGTLILDNAAAEITVGASLTVTNAMTVSAGSVAVSGTLVAANLSDAGSITNSRKLDVTNLTNPGTIQNTGTMIVRGSITPASLGHIEGTNGVLDLLRVVTNTGGTLDGAALQSQFVQSIGTIVGGSVANLSNIGTLAEADGVTWLGELSVSGFFTVQSGLTLTGSAGSGPGTLALAYATINFVGDQTIDNAAVSGDGFITANNSLTIGAGFDFSQVGHQLGVFIAIDSLNVDGNGSIINHGTFVGISGSNFGNSGANFSLSFDSADFENFGVIDVMDKSDPPGSDFPGQSLANISNGDFTNRPGGIVEAGRTTGTAEVTIAAAVNFVNDGMMLTKDPGSSVGGTIDIAAILNGSGTIDVNGGGLAHLRSAASDTQNIDFAGAGTLMMDTPAFDPVIINGFTVADTIALGVAATAVSYTSGDLKLQVSGGQTFDLNITGAFDLSDFTVDTQTSSTFITTTCFATDTRLATPRGSVAVEDLREGDAMLLEDATSTADIVWISHREVDCLRHPDPRRVWPVRIAAGAFAPNIPERDLLLSPDHAVFVNGNLIPAKYLINGSTITQQAVPRIEYWHVELPTHAVILAEGLAVESLLPGSHRVFADDGAEVIPLYPDHTARNWEMRSCAPLIVTGPELRAVQTMLARRPMERRRAA